MMDLDTSRAPRASTTSTGFLKADSSNLPHVDECMILEYIASSSQHNIAEIRGAKILMSSRDSYLETAVGYVELQRNVLNECIVRAKVTPEHKITNKNYIVTVTLNEKDNIINNAVCDGCAASAGGCKHTLVFLFWLNKKSNEPASTSIQCYWNKPKLANVRNVPIDVENIFKKSKKIKLMEKDSSILTSFKEQCKKHNINNDSMILLFTGSKKKSYNLFDMALEYIQNHDINFENFKKELDIKITPDIIKEINDATISQSNSKMWHSVRQGRITASKIYEASQCKTDGALVQQILGGYKVPQTRAIKRGQNLEKNVIEELEAKLQKKIEKSGFILINSLIGASPDGVGDDFIVEVKCPISEQNMKNYVSDNKIKNKFVAQMQTQMMAANKSKGLFCVADPTFETTKKIHTYWIQYDPLYIESLIQKAIQFWKSHVSIPKNYEQC